MISSVRVIVSTRQRLERGSEQAAPLARVDSLEPLMLAFPASGRQSIFLGATGPRATRSEETRRGATLVGQGRLAAARVGKKGWNGGGRGAGKQCGHVIVEITAGMLRAACSLTGLS